MSTPGGYFIDVSEEEIKRLLGEGQSHSMTSPSSSDGVFLQHIDGIKTPGVEGSGTLGPLNPELVILDIKEESIIEVESAVKKEPDVKEEIPSSDEEKIDIKDESSFEHTEHRDDCQKLMKEEEIILIKSEPCHCTEYCDCAKSEPLPDNDGETMVVENIEPLFTQNLAEELGQNRLRKPISFHSDHKYFYCDVCDYKCLPQAHMEYHLRKHTGEKPLACGYCDYRASHPTTMTRHIRSQHTGEKPYSCKVCDYKTAHPAALARHMRTHTGEKPFKCDRCDLRTADLSSLNAHKFSHTGETPFKCQLCQFSTSRKRGLRRHLIRVHPEAPPLPSPMILSVRTQNQNAGSIGKSTVRSRNFKGEWSCGKDSMSSGSESGDDSDSSIDVDSDTNVIVDEWALPDASSSGRRIRAPNRLDL